jgi:hypothetical protein
MGVNEEADVNVTNTVESDDEEDGILEEVKAESDLVDDRFH